MNIHKLARALCKVDLDPAGTITPERLWRQMRPEVRESYRNRARQVSDLMEEMTYDPTVVTDVNVD